MGRTNTKAQSHEVLGFHFILKNMEPFGTEGRTVGSDVQSAGLRPGAGLAARGRPGTMQATDPQDGGSGAN